MILAEGESERIFDADHVKLLLDPLHKLLIYACMSILQSKDQLSTRQY